MSSALEQFEINEACVVEVPLDRVWRFSVNQYHELISAGVLTEDDRVELIDGLLVRKMSKNPPHVFALEALREFLLRCALQRWILRSQDPITLDDSEPEPDLVVARGSRRDYTQRHPQPADIGLVVEVADATLADDRGYKNGLYARNGIAEYWIVNLVHQQIEVYTEPTGRGLRAGYRVKRTYEVEDCVPFTLDGVELGNVPVAELLAK